jgi:Glycosyltransferase family 87
MSEPSPARRRFAWLALLLVLAGGAHVGQRLVRTAAFVVPIDFMEYWAAGRLIARGENPYDPGLVRAVQRDAGMDPGMAVMMWNPPWALPVVLPLGLLPISTALLVWWAVQFIALFASAELLWRGSGGPPGKSWLAWLLTATFAPVTMLLGAGQITGLVLLGVAGFYYALRCDRPAQAGACAALGALKPHLLVLFALGLLLDAGSRRGRQMLLGGIATLGVATAIPLLLNPHILGQYVDVTTAGDSADHRGLGWWFHPNIGSWLRIWIGGSSWTQALPCLAAVLVFLVYRARHRCWDWSAQMPPVVVASVVTAPYGAWGFDAVLLLAALIPLAARALRAPSPGPLAALLLGHAVLSGLMFAAMLAHMEGPSYVWFAPAVAVEYVLISRWCTAAESRPRHDTAAVAVDHE